MASISSKFFTRLLSKNIKFTLKHSYKCYPTVLNRLYNQIPACTIKNPIKVVSYHKSCINMMDSKSAVDPSSFAQPDLHVIKHVSLKLNVDFAKKVLEGTATLSVDVLNDNKTLVLDSENLNIESVTLDNGTKCEYKIHEPVPNFGSKLTIELPTTVPNKDSVTSSKCFTVPLLKNMSNESEISPASATGEVSNTTQMKLNGSFYKVNVPTSKKFHMPRIINILIKYSTSPSASGLQWLEPRQTASKKHPYLFSQCQPIHARSILPCQDSPAVKFTYDAEVTVPEPFTVLMSAIKQESAGNTSYFTQPVPIPSYLLAVAVGVLASKKLGPRSTIWAEEPVVESAAWEFAETEKYLQAAEKLCGKYVWTQYDLLVLPPSFPYGGMENPCLTFVTPTLLAGDRSQANVIVHEIMHSWTGNLVTNKNFEHFWLNEGFTVFLERKVQASLIEDKVISKQERDFQSILGVQELSDTIKSQFKESDELTRLIVDLKGIHPDDAFSRVPYEKGSLFLRVIEDLVGGPEVFDKFLYTYLDHFQRQSIDSNQFKQYLLDYFKKNTKIQKFDFDKWFYTTGMPPSVPDYDTTMAESVTKLVKKLSVKNPKFSYEDVKDFTPSQMIHFLQCLIEISPLSISDIQTMGAIYQVDSSKNTEIEYRWYRLCIKSKDLSKLDEIFNFVNRQGRMKYVRPIYRDLYQWEEVRERAISNFKEHEQDMMHVSAYTVRKDLKLAGNETVKE